MSPVDTPQPVDEPETDRSRRWMPFVVVATLALVLIAVAVVVVVGTRSNDDARSRLAARQAQVEANGRRVMPFDQNRTTHRFTKTATGGVEKVTANDPADTGQATLIQSHLEHEQQLFSKGDFSDPMAIHGMAMPGIDDLRQGAMAGNLTVAYEVLPSGAQLTYTASGPQLVSAIHQWFDAQLMDHGAHATG